MARRTIDENIKLGILSIPNLVEITGLSSFYIRKLIALAIEAPATYFPVLVVPESKEVRIPAGPFYSFCVSHRFPIPNPLHLAAVNYNNRYVNSPPPPPPQLFIQSPALALHPSVPPDAVAPLESPSAPAIYAKAEGPPASFVPTAPPLVDEMTPYMNIPMLPLPLHPDSPLVSTGKSPVSSTSPLAPPALPTFPDDPFADDPLAESAEPESPF